MFFLAILLGLVFLGWVALGTFVYWSVKGGTVLRPGSYPELAACPPKVSILVPARNEAEILSAVLESLLCLDYPDFEIILVNDCSTDATGQIAEEWAARPEGQGKLRVIQNRDLPADWTGKVHSLSLAADAATGEWLLATDADVLFHPDALRCAVAYATERDLQLLSIAPECELASFWEKMVMPVSFLFLLLWYPPRLVNNPRSKRAAAAGAFILMRRKEFKSLGGYQCLRSVLLEDIGTAQLFKHHYLRTHLAMSRGLLQTRMYRGWHEIWEGLCRNAFEGVGYSVSRLLMNVMMGNLLTLLPWTALVALTLCFPWLKVTPAYVLAFSMALAACAIGGLIYLPVLKALRVPVLFVLTIPLSALVVSAASWHSAWSSLYGKGVPWKNRHYRQQPKVGCRKRS